MTSYSNTIIPNNSNNPVWISPASGSLGTLTVGTSVNQTFVATDPNNGSISYSILPNNSVLPAGLSFVNNTITGAATALNATQTTYEFLIRATSNSGYISDRYFYFSNNSTSFLPYFSTNWLSSLYTTTIDNTVFYQLGVVTRGSSFNVQFVVENPANVELNYRIMPTLLADATNDGDMPTGLTFINGVLGGVPELTNNPGNYCFIVEVTSGTTVIQNYFYITVTSGVSLTPSSSTTVVWDTPAGNLGTLNESYASYFAVAAHTPDNQTIVYSLSPTSNPLPAGLNINSTTGQIVGLCAFVFATTVYSFTVRATSGSNYSDRTFSITVNSLFGNSTDILTFYAEITDDLRQDLQSTIQLNTVLTQNLFRPADSNWGYVEYFNMYIVGGLKSTTPVDIVTQLSNYAQPMTMTLGNLSSAVAYDSAGNYWYDVVYISVIDPMTKAGGFTASGVEQLVSTPFALTNGIPAWNLPAESTRIFPNSIENIRQDLIQTTNRIAWTDPETGNTILAANAEGIGLAGTEALPDWMNCPQTVGNPNSILGYTPAIVLAYCNPGTGATVVSNLVAAGFNTKYSGLTFEIDRFAVSETVYTNTTFDLGLNGFYTETALVTPYICSVSAINTEQTQTIVISGWGFGTMAPFDGTSPSIAIQDTTKSWNAGNTGNLVTLNVTSWIDTRIVISGFTGQWGSNNWTLDSGDVITIAVKNAQSNGTSAVATQTVGSPTATYVADFSTTTTGTLDGLETTFDGPNQILFDESLQSTTKYYKFAPGDLG